MTDRHITIVYRLPDDFDAAELTDHTHMSACSWSHALKEVKRLRDLLDEAYADADDVLRPRVKYLEEQVSKLQNIEKAARNLIAQKGRHNTAIAYQELEEAFK